MNQEELQDRILMLNHLEQQEVNPAAPYDPSDGMNESELRNYVRFLYEQVNAKDKSIQELLEELRGMRKDYKELLSRIDSLTQQLEKINLENRDLKEQNGILKSELYNSSKSRKGIKKNQRTKGKNPDDDNPADDSPSPESSSTNSVCSVEQEKHESDTVYHGPSRKVQLTISM